MKIKFKVPKPTKDDLKCLGLMLMISAVTYTMEEIYWRKKNKKDIEVIQDIYREVYQKMYEEKLQQLQDELFEKTKAEVEQMKEDVAKLTEPEEEPIDISNVVVEIEHSKAPTSNKIYTIEPDQFGEKEGYERETYVYYAGDEVFVDRDLDTIVDESEIMELTNGEATSHFGDFEEDAAYFRNEETKSDIVIYWDPTDYGEDDE